MPAALSFSMTVASYGGTQPSRIFEAAVVSMPLVTIISLMAIGTPASSGSAALSSALLASKASAWSSA
ncbi:unknown [Bifidobacterium bifidum CAG:234]|nr:unknown [Bifidobacterium bifidum CAG:234]